MERHIDAILKLADYHRKAMESRRTVGFQALIAVFALDGAIFLKAKELVSAPTYTMDIAVLVASFSLCIFVGYLHTVLEIEKRNTADRMRYAALESRAWKTLDGTRWRTFYSDFANADNAFVPKRTMRQLINGAWASSAAVVSAFLLLLVILYHLWSLHV